MLPNDQIELLTFLTKSVKKNLEAGIMTEEELYAALTPIQRAEYEHMKLEAEANYQTREF